MSKKIHINWGKRAFRPVVSHVLRVSLINSCKACKDTRSSDLTKAFSPLTHKKGTQCSHSELLTGGAFQCYNHIALLAGWGWWGRMEQSLLMR